MATTYSILLLGLQDSAESLASAHFTKCGHRVLAVGTGVAGNEALKDPQIHLIYMQPSSDKQALDEFRRIRLVRADLPVVIVSKEQSVSAMREAWHAGAADVLGVPLTAEALDFSLKRCAQQLPELSKQPPAEVQARFRYLDDMGKERWVSLVPPRFTIGRSSTSDLVLSQMSVSRAHAEVLVEEGNYVLKDLGSKHGTFLNGQRIEQSELRSGDRVQLGGLQGQQITFHKGDLLQSLLGPSETLVDTGLSIRGFREVGLLLATFRALSSIPLLDDLLALVVDTAIELTGA